MSNIVKAQSYWLDSELGDHVDCGLEIVEFYDSGLGRVTDYTLKCTNEGCEFDENIARHIPEDVELSGIFTYGTIS